MNYPVAGGKTREGKGNCSDCALRQTLICSDVSRGDLATFHSWVDDLAFPPGTVLYHMEAPADGFYCLRSGTVKLVRYSMSGVARIVRILKGGDVAGLEAAFADTFAHTAVAVGEVRACRIPLSRFRHMMRDNPPLQRRLLEKSQQALAEVETWLAELAGGIGAAPARQRLARLLLSLRDGPSDRIHRFSIEDLGGMLGISMETASRILSDLTRQGFLEKCGSGRAERHFRADIAALEKIAVGEAVPA